MRWPCKNDQKPPRGEGNMVDAEADNGSDLCHQGLWVQVQGEANMITDLKHVSVNKKRGRSVKVVPLGREEGGRAAVLVPDRGGCA
jgi:hypothetical protein